jgi:hypothetical protein
MDSDLQMRLRYCDQDDAARDTRGLGGRVNSSNT